MEVIATQIASKEAPLAASISMKLPLSSPERAIASLVAWQNRVAKGQEKHQHVVFRYKAGWGPQTKMNTSRYYPTKEIAARAIHQWAGDDWANRVITKHQSLVHLQIGEEPEAVQEARITSMVRNLRCNYVSWLQKKVTPELVKEDETRQSLRFVEDDRLEKQLEELADKNCLPEEWQDALSQALKCETDKWEGWVVYLGPLALAAICQVYGISVEAYKLEELEELGSFPPCMCCLAYSGVHFVPFWQKAWHGPFMSRPWIDQAELSFAERFERVATKLDCNLDVTSRAAGDCLPHGALILLEMHLSRRGGELVAQEEDVEMAEVEPLPLEVHWKIGSGFWGQGLTALQQRRPILQAIQGSAQHAAQIAQ